MDKKIIDEALNSVTLDEVLSYGETIDDSGEYDAFYSDAPGGQFTQLKIVKHNEKFYVYKEKVIEGMDLSQKRECIAFYELK